MKRYNVITLDWDIEYADAKKSVSYSVLRSWLAAHRHRAAYLRQSAFGNTHVKIILYGKIDEYTLLKTRAFLRDDVYRLKMDLLRAYRGLEVNRLWDSKIEAGKLKKAGPWRRIRAGQDIYSRRGKPES